jgi:regulatory protein
VGAEAAASARALERAYRYLNRRERTVHEVRQHLSGLDLEARAVDVAVAELIEAGYLDDERYARLFVQDKRELEEWGSVRIRRALEARGVKRDVVDAALTETTGSAHAGPGAGAGSEHTVAGEFERAVSLLERRFPAPPRERRDRQRALGMLVRRGYDLELAVAALGAYARGID